MRLTRGHLLLVFGLLAGAGGLAVIFVPDVLPPEVEQFRDLLDRQLVFRFAMGLAGVVVLAALFRLLRPNATQVDRSPITQQPPEVVTANTATETDRRARTMYRRAVAQFSSTDRSTRYVAIYGRRAQTAVEINQGLEQYLRELADVVAATYATSVGCDETTATHAVETGQWTDDRVAAAFLATDLDSDVSFTVWERFTAWVAPERVFRARVQRVLDEAELYADSYLTYRGVASKNPDAPTAGQAAGAPDRTADQTEGPQQTDYIHADGGRPTAEDHAANQDGEQQ